MALGKMELGEMELGKLSSHQMNLWVAVSKNSNSPVYMNMNKMCQYFLIVSEQFNRGLSSLIMFYSSMVIIVIIVFRGSMKHPQVLKMG